MRALVLALILVAAAFPFVDVGRCEPPTSSSAAPDSTSAAPPAEDADKPAPFFEGLGQRHFAITTDSELAQRYFDQGMALAYGFNHPEAARSFREVVKLDPDCAMGWWGIALVLGPNINAPMEKTDVPEAWASMNKAHEFAHLASAKEQALIDALLKRYVADAPEDRTALDVAYADAMRAVEKSYPKDVDVVTLTAEALMDLHPWNFYDRKTFEAREWTPEVVDLLEKALALDVKHPGANHYYIHLTEASPKPDRAIECGERLGKLCPGQGHLVHMPSHVYIRTGQYHEASRVNEAAIKADDGYVSACHAQGIYTIAYQPHNHHFLWATAGFEGASAKALAAARHTAGLVTQELIRDPFMSGAMQHWSVVPIYGMVRFGWWKDILLEPEPPEDLVYMRAVRHYARCLAFERFGKPDDADAELAALRAVQKDPRMEPLTIIGLNQVSSLVAIAERVATGEIASSRGRHEEAIAALHEASEKEDTLTYDEPPEWYFPTRHNLGAALLAASQPIEAEKVYREDLRLYPENGWSLIGLEQALAAQGKADDAKAVHKRFEKAWANADFELHASRL